MNYYFKLCNPGHPSSTATLLSISPATLLSISPATLLSISPATLLSISPATLISISPATLISIKLYNPVHHTQARHPVNWLALPLCFYGNHSATLLLCKPLCNPAFMKAACLWLCNSVVSTLILWTLLWLCNSAVSTLLLWTLLWLCNSAVSTLLLWTLLWLYNSVVFRASSATLLL